MSKTTKKDDDIISPSIHLEMVRALEEHDMNPRELSAKLNRGDGTKGWAYDYIRKIYNGQTFPGALVTKSICDYFNLDFDSLWRKIKYDEGVYKGRVPPGEDKKLMQVGRYWNYLSDIDQDEIIAQVKSRAEFRMKKFKNDR